MRIDKASRQANWFMVFLILITLLAASVPLNSQPTVAVAGPVRSCVLAIYRAYWRGDSSVMNSVDAMERECRK